MIEEAGKLNYNYPGLAACGGYGKIFAIGQMTIEYCCIDENIWFELSIFKDAMWG